MRILIIIFFVLTNLQISFGQESENLDSLLASKVLSRASDIVIAVEHGPTIEVIAFNQILRSVNGREAYKKIYNTSTLAGKVYCVVGLSLLKDEEYEKYRLKLISEKCDEGIYFQVGSKRSMYITPKDLLNSLLEGLSTNVWYAPSFILRPQKKTEIK